MPIEDNAEPDRDMFEPPKEVIVIKPWDNFKKVVSQENVETIYNDQLEKIRAKRGHGSDIEMGNFTQHICTMQNTNSIVSRQAGIVKSKKYGLDIEAFYSNMSQAVCVHIDGDTSMDHLKEYLPNLKVRDAIRFGNYNHKVNKISDFNLEKVMHLYAAGELQKRMDRVVNFLEKKVPDAMGIFRKHDGVEVIAQDILNNKLVVKNISYNAVLDEEGENYSGTVEIIGNDNNVQVNGIYHAPRKFVDSLEWLL